MKKLTIPKKKSNYGSKEWVDKVLSNENLTIHDLKRFAADMHRTRHYRAGKILIWAIDKKLKGEWSNLNLKQ